MSVPIAMRSRVVLVACAVVAAATTATLVMVPETAAAECPAAAGKAYRPAPPPSPPAQVVFQGYGWGHGVGMSQYGAQGAARLGCTASEILATYYSGTSLATRTDRPSVGVRMLDDETVASVVVERGRVVWRNGSALLAIQTAGLYRVRWLSATTVELSDGVSPVWSGTADVDGLRAVIKGSVITLDSPEDTYGKLPMQLTYDSLHFTPHAGGMDVVKWFTDSSRGRALDKYLFGLAEVPGSWPAEALRAQAIAARTFAYKKNAVLRPTSSDQNYRGYDQELSDAASGGALHAAVLATSGQIVIDESDRAIDAFYSSSMGGHTEDVRYSWGGVGASYLLAVNDSRWDRASDNPTGFRAWAVGKTRAQVAAALGFTTITSITVAPRGKPERVEGVKVVGTKSGGAVTQFIPGFTVRTALGLLSPGFEITMNP